MKNPVFRSVMAVLGCLLALFAVNAPVAAEPSGVYLETSIGMTRSPAIDDFGFDPATDMAVLGAIGTSISQNARIEAEVSYLRTSWDVGGVDLTADGFGAGTNVLYDVRLGSSPAKLELGLGVGWLFGDEACLEDGGARLCSDGLDDDWTMQGILGGSFALSESSSIVLRYRMQNVGGFSSEDRLHVFTAGYRHHF